MFDTMTMTKVVGACCGSLLVFLMGSWAAQSIFTIGPSGHGAADEHAQAYLIDTGAAESSEGESADAEVDVAALIAAADVAAGEKVFGKCKACHKIDGTDSTGPHLNGVVGRAEASVAGFGYSEGLKSQSADAWTPERLFVFLENPKAFVPGTKMAFAGLPKPADRANVIAYLASLP